MEPDAADWGWIRVALNPHVPELSALDLLVTIARRGSLSAAAAELGISQQAVSSRLRAIEAQVAVPLITRTPRGSWPTEAGQAVIEWASRVLLAAAQLDVGIAALRRDRDAHLRVAASLTVAEYLLPRWLVTLRARRSAALMPDAQVVLAATNSTNVIERVGSGEADLGFVEGPQPPTGLRWRAVALDRLVVVVRPDHPWARRRRPVTAAELSRTALVTREPGSGTRVALEHALLAAAPDVPSADPAIELPSTAAVRAAVLAGAGPAVLSALTVADDLQTGRLAPVAQYGLSLERSLRAVWRGAAQPPSGPARQLVGIAAEGLMATAS